jgi:FkbM family methyltransferase
MLSIRTVLERASRQREFTRSLPPEFGRCKIRVSPEGGLRYYRPDFWSIDRNLLNLALDLVRPGRIVWDVGANVGLFSVAASYLTGPSGKVIAFEPDGWLAGLLRKTNRLGDPNNQAEIEVISCAIADAEYLARFNIAERSRSSNYLEGAGTTQAGGVRSSETTLVKSLDWMAKFRPAPDLLKIDVEGVEAAVLNGAKNILRTKRPIILVEVGSESADVVADCLHSEGYELFDGDSDNWPESRISLCTWNTLAIPNNSLESILHEVSTSANRKARGGERPK